MGSREIGKKIQIRRPYSSSGWSLAFSASASLSICVIPINRLLVIDRAYHSPTALDLFVEFLAFVAHDKVSAFARAAIVGPSKL